MMTIEDMRRMAALAGERALVMALPSKAQVDMLARLSRIETRCNDLDDQAAPFSVVDREQIGRDSRCIRGMVEELRALVLGRA